MADEIISRAEAQARGLKYFFTGIPCKHGHLCKRQVANRSCYECILRNHRKYHFKNRDDLLAANKEYKRANKDRYIALRKEQYSKERDLILKKGRDWYAANIELARETRRKWRNANKDLYLSFARNYRARKSGAVGVHSLADLAEILRLQKNRCAHCRCSFGKDLRPTLDHIIALSRGGSNDRKNLQYLCGPCNSSKNDRDPIEFAQSAGRLI
jgi:5-methylcytosine-specific restriction endonuclease McrA